MVDFLTVVWQCDKKNCKKDNLRVLEIGATIIDDQCEHCEKLIREPIWLEIEIDTNSINESYENSKRDEQHGQ